MTEFVLSIVHAIAKRTQRRVLELLMHFIGMLRIETGTARWIPLICNGLSGGLPTASGPPRLPGERAQQAVNGGYYLCTYRLVGFTISHSLLMRFIAVSQAGPADDDEP